MPPIAVVDGDPGVGVLVDVVAGSVGAEDGSDDVVDDEPGPGRELVDDGPVPGRELVVVDGLVPGNVVVVDVDVVVVDVDVVAVAATSTVVVTTGVSTSPEDTTVAVHCTTSTASPDCGAGS